MMRQILGHMRQWRPTAKEILGRSIVFTKFLCALHVTNHYLFSPSIVCGASMFPTMNAAGEVVLAEHVSHRLGRVDPGDVVVVTSPVEPGKTLTKRVLGTEGDVVTYVVNPNESDRCRTVVVPKGHVWIQGDNIYASSDSRQFGPVPYGLIQGKVFFRVWPHNGFGSLRHWQ